MDSIQKPDDRPSHGSNTCDTHSFDPDTLVLMADGTTRAIKDLAVGDMVVATEPETGETTERAVTDLHVNLDRELTTLTLAVLPPFVALPAGANGDGVGEGEGDRSTRGPTSTLETTRNHPLWDVTTASWVHAGELVAGQSVVTGPDGSRQLVVAVDNYVGAAEMRDLTIATVHTYYVLAGSTPVLVHNTGPCGTGTVWADVVGTQPAIPGTGGLPKSFELTAGGNRVWVHGNVTDHFAEMANSMAARGASPDMIRLATQQQLRSLQAAVADATRRGVSLNQRMTVGGWQLEFRQGPGDALPALIHGRYIG